MFTASTMYFTANGRVVYAFSRDGAMLGSRWWRQLSPRTQQPVAGVWLMAALSFLIGSPAVFVRQYLNALSATCVIALTLSCAIPIALGLWRGPEGYVHGVFHLGRWSRPLAAASCVWVALICTVFCLPMVYPVTALNANWAPLMLGLLLVFALALCRQHCTHTAPTPTQPPSHLAAAPS
ncbi:APC amino acid permease, partial [Haematococcus lacustris]